MHDQYECDSCGSCCRHLIVEIEELDMVRELRLIPVSEPFRIDEGMFLVDDDGEPVEEVIPGYGAGALLAAGTSLPCPLLGADNLCGIYPTRPACCVAFRAGSDQCQTAREAAGLTRLLPITTGVLPVLVATFEPNGGGR